MLPARASRIADPHVGAAILAAVLRNPAQVGAVVPTSDGMAELLSPIVPRSGEPVVVELGPGTGAVTGVIDDRLTPAARHMAVEPTPEMAAY